MKNANAARKNNAGRVVIYRVVLATILPRLRMETLATTTPWWEVTLQTISKWMVATRIVA